MIPIAKPLIGSEEKEAVMRVLDSGCIAQGPEVAAFEKEFASFCGADFAVATTSGTTALHLALLALGIGEGDEVITTPFSFIASSNSILYTGAKPVFCDIKEDTFNIDPSKIEALITTKTKAILPVHLYGQAAEMDKIMAIAKKHNLFVIEDACQAHGAQIDGKSVGSIGEAACFSFYPTKNMTCAEGGMATFRDKEVYEKAQMIRAHGMKVRYYHENIGFNFRMTDVHAAIGREQLKKLPEFNKKRQQNANYLLKKITNPKVELPITLEGYSHVFHQFTIKIADRDESVERLTEAGIGTGIYYPVSINEQAVYTKLGYKSETKVAQDVSTKVFSLPVHPGLAEKDLKEIVRAVNDL
jgi:dTDP-4-amino-4,6-dideoxygalactose transaminase